LGGALDLRVGALDKKVSQGVGTQYPGGKKDELVKRLTTSIQLHSHPEMGDSKTVLELPSWCIPDPIGEMTTYLWEVRIM